MISTTTRTLHKCLASMAMGLALMGFSQLAAATSTALSISQVPLFITISMPPNILVLLDDSGSMQWAHLPDWFGEEGEATVYVTGQSANSTTTTTVTATATPTSSCISSHHGSCSEYSYNCSSGYTLSGSGTGTSSTPPSGDVCQKSTSTTTYSCPTGDTSSGSGSSTTCAGYESFGTNLSIANDTSSGGPYVPDTNHYKCACFNPLAYDPTISYTAGYNDTGSAHLTTSFTAAYVNPYVTSAGTINLSTSYQATVDYNPSTTASTLTGSTSHDAFNNVQDEQNSCNGSFTYTGSSTTGTPTCSSVWNPQAAFYYLLTPTSTSAVANGCGTHTIGTTTTVVPENEDDSCLTKVVVSATSGPGGTDERQNFANWYSFYRTRNLTVNTSANIAFTGLNSTYRVAWRDLNTCSSFASTGCQGWNSTSYDNRIATFSGTHRQNFFDWLAHYPANNGTPLRTGLETMGTYYTTSGTSSPYAFNPQVTDSPEYVCRPNYAMIMTDGLWNDSSIPTSVGNADSTTVTLPDGTAYPPTSPSSSHPYSDSSSNSLADIAFHYWETNLRPDLGLSSALEFITSTKSVTVTDTVGNNATLIPYWNPQNDPASWPHMVTFTVGLGMETILTSPQWTGNTFSGGYDNVVTGNVAWPAVASNSSNNAYDLWHAAIDGRGQFFNADTPTDVQAAFNSIVGRIQGRIGSSSSVAVNSTRLDSNTFIYQGEFNSANWTGELQAFQISTSGSIATTPTWQASTQIPAAASRNILSWDETQNSGAGGGITFQWTSLNTAEQTDLNRNINLIPDSNGSLRLNYLRGDQSEEQSQSGGIFRIRASLLGDIVDSNPLYVGTQNFGYSSNTVAVPEGASYGTFLGTKASRTPMLYVGAGDGMLHAFNANTGAEVFAYIPRGVYPNLMALPDPLYTHEFYVDSSPATEDAYLGGAWKSLVAGATGAGGTDEFVLDVTNPSSEASSNVLWDYDGVDGSITGVVTSASNTTAALSLPDPNMGYTIGESSIIRMNDGDYYVLFGNGYDSTNNQAAIYLYDLTAKVLRIYSTGVGSATSPNGMSSPTPVDFNGDRITDAVYAGDLRGNLWKLDVSSTNRANWKFNTYGNSVATPLFTAYDASGNVQPITEAPQVGLNSSSQVMVFFGTGTYFLTGDNTVGSNPPVMSFYGIIDDKGNTAADQVKGTSSTNRSELLQQFIVGTVTSTSNGNTYRVTTTYSMTSSDQGWYIDLVPYNGQTQGTAVGERSVSDAVLDEGRILFATMIPEGNACQYGGISFLMELNINTGGAMTTATFDTNGDGQENNQDLLTLAYTDPNSGNSTSTTEGAAGLEFTSGTIKTPAVIQNGPSQELVTNNSGAGLGAYGNSGSTNGGRLSWQQLQ